MEKNIKIKHLISLGYREMKPDVYGKPVGMNLFTVELDKMLFTNWFKSNDTIHIYDSEEIKYSEEFLETIKCIEAYSKLIQPTNGSNFEFLNINEVLDI